MKNNEEKIVINRNWYNSIQHLPRELVIKRIQELIPTNERSDEKNPKLLTWNKYIPQHHAQWSGEYRTEDEKILIDAIPEEGTGFGKIITLSNGSRYIILEYDDETIFVVVPEEKFEVVSTEEVLAAHC